MTTEEAFLAREKKRDEISLNRDKMRYAQDLKKHFSKELTEEVVEEKKLTRFQKFWKNIKTIL